MSLSRMVLQACRGAVASASGPPGEPRAATTPNFALLQHGDTIAVSNRSPDGPRLPTATLAGPAALLTRLQPLRAVRLHHARALSALHGTQQQQPLAAAVAAATQLWRLRAPCVAAGGQQQRLSARGSHVAAAAAQQAGGEGSSSSSDEEDEEEEEEEEDGDLVGEA